MLTKIAEAAKPAPLRYAIGQIRRIQIITVTWMSAEVALSLYAAWKARSPALLGFGGDSFIELFSAIVVWWRFASGAPAEQAERRAAKVAGVLLFALAALVAGSSAVTFLGHNEPRPTRLGIGILMAAAVVMPWLAKEKRRLARVTGSSALKADAAESAMCGYLSVIALIGLLCNAIWHVSWADPVAALCLLPLIVREAWEALGGRREC